MKRRPLLVSLAGGLMTSSLPAFAQSPARPVHLIVPFAAGGPSDQAARRVAQALGASTGQHVVVENRPGANGAVAAQAVFFAPPDGHTLLWAVGSMVAIPLLQKKAPFDSLAELAPVSLVGRFAFGLFVHPGVPAHSVAELVTHARANAGGLNYASSTLGEFLAATQLMKATGISMVRVPYQGGAQALPDLIEGRVQVSFAPLALRLPHVRAGRLRLLATLLPERSAAAPDVPTLAEAGIAGVTVPSWQAVFAPPKTAADMAERLSLQVQQIVRDPAVRADLERLELQVQGSTPQALAALVADEQQAWARFVRDNAVAPE